MLQRSTAGRIEFVELFYDRSTALRRISRLAVTATSIRCVLSGRGPHDPGLLALLAAVGERRIMVEPQLGGFLATTQTLSRLWPDVRVGPDALRSVLVFDDSSAALPLDPCDLDVGAMVLRGPLASPYGQLFDLMWSDACRPGEAVPPQGVGLSPRQIEVVEMLLRGATDYQVANRLGMSSRTVRAVVAQLQERFGTRSRMALGYQLARLNGLDIGAFCR